MIIIGTLLICLILKVPRSNWPPNPRRTRPWTPIGKHTLYNMCMTQLRNGQRSGWSMSMSLAPRRSTNDICSSLCWIIMMANFMWFFFTFNTSKKKLCVQRWDHWYQEQYPLSRRYVYKVGSLCGNYTDMDLSLFWIKREIQADALRENTLRSSESGALWRLSVLLTVLTNICSTTRNIYKSFMPEITGYASLSLSLWLNNE